MRYLGRMRKVSFLFLAFISAVHACGQASPANASRLHEATLQIFERLCETQHAENRGDTLFFEMPACGGGRPCGALLLDDLLPLSTFPHLNLGVFRIFNVTSTADADKGSEQWEALTYLGTGRGYQVKFGIAVFNDSTGTLKLNSLDLNVGYLGEGFRLPEYQLHEFGDGKSPFGALVFVNRSWRVGFGHTTLSVLDLGDVNNHEFTLHHTVEAQRVEGYWDDGEEPSQWLQIKAIWDNRYGQSTNPERNYECTLDWYFVGRTLIIEEHPSYTYWDKIDFDRIVDSTIVLPVRWNEFRQEVWPPRYLRVLDKQDN